MSYCINYNQKTFFSLQYINSKTDFIIILFSFKIYLFCLCLSFDKLNHSLMSRFHIIDQQALQNKSISNSTISSYLSALNLPASSKHYNFISIIGS